MPLALSEQPLEDDVLNSESDFQEATGAEPGETPAVTRRALQQLLGSLGGAKKSGEVKNDALKTKKHATGAFGISKSAKRTTQA